MEQSITYTDPEHGDFPCQPETLEKVALRAQGGKALRAWAENATDGALDFSERPYGALLVIVASLVDERLNGGHDIREMGDVL